MTASCSSSVGWWPSFERRDRMRRLSLAVVGAGFDNKVGPSRLFEISMCKPGEEIRLKLEPKNPADPNAVAVYSARDIQIGYISAERAPLVGGAMRRGVVDVIFQSAEPWGAVIRAHLDGTTATLPTVAKALNSDPKNLNEAQDWWPDEEWPD